MYLLTFWVHPIFQNISCYCLTPRFQAQSHLLISFQNISCYCLTASTTASLLCLNSFQNISCYCLTSTLSTQFEDLGIFQNISCYCLTIYWYSGVYPLSISKHLMLLFNVADTYSQLGKSNFKTSHVIV